MGDTLIERFQQAIAFHERGQLAEAKEIYAQIIALDPEQPDALHLLGVALVQSGQVEPGARLIQRSLELNAAQPVAITNLGNALRAMQRHDEALGNYERSIRLQPQYALAHLGRSTVLADLGRYEEALASLDRAVQLNPALFEAHYQRGHVLRQLGRFEDALGAYQRALQLCAKHPDVLWCIGTMHMAAGRWEQATATFKVLTQAAPDYPLARGALLHAQLNLFDWDSYASSVENILEALTADRMPDHPLSFLAISDSPELQLKCAHQMRPKIPATELPRWRRASAGHQRIRLAYVSADFLEHPMAYLMAGLFEAHDRERFDIIAISLRSDPNSPTARRLLGAFDRYLDAAGQSDEKIASLIRDLEVDIAVDLMGYSAEAQSGILASRPAPLQVSYIGFPATMGARHIDYIIADEFVIPPQSAPFYSECIAYLPDCYQANDERRSPAATTASRADEGLPDGGFVFCSFRSNFKINPPLFDVWVRLLLAVPSSVLWLVETSAAANLRREAARRGLDPRRLIFAKRKPYPQHLARHGLADLCLDTWPFNGGATTSDALWAGVPVVTCVGRSFVSRMAGSLLRTIGLPELVTDNFADYERLAYRLAVNLGELAAIRAKLAFGRANSPLFKTDPFRQHLETAYRMMWDRSLRGQPPASFVVPR